MVQFTTQVATSIEQSQQLIELGVKPETADLVYRCTKSKTDSLEWELQLCPPSLENIDNNDIPAWSLVRLLELLPYEIPCDRPNVLHHPELIKYEAGYNFSVCRYTVDCFAGTHIENSPFDSCVSMIKWLIAKGYFSKEFLLLEECLLLLWMIHVIVHSASSRKNITGGCLYGKIGTRLIHVHF